MERRRMNAGRLVRIAAVVTAVAMVVTGVTLAVFPGGAGSRPAPGVLAPGSQGSAGPHPWWDPWGWFRSGGPDAPHGRTIAADGGPQVGRRLHQAAAPVPRRVREVVGKRNANTRVYRLADGRSQADISAGPMNYLDRTGRWQPINTTVRRVARPGYVDGNTTNTFRSYFGSSAGRLVRFEAPGAGTLSLALDGASAKAPHVTGSTISYTDVAAAASLRYQVTPSALKESITLAAPSAVSSYSYTIKVGGGLVP